MAVYNSIQLDLCKKNSYKAIPTKQLDTNSRFLKVELLNNGSQYDFNDDVTVILASTRNGETKAYKCTVEDGCVVAPLTSWMLAEEGYVDCEIVLVDTASNSKLSSFAFSICVDESIYNDETITQDENYNVLLQLITDVDTAVKSCNTATEKATEIYNTVKTKLNDGELKGEKGDKGDRGDQGIKGDKGEQGIKGDPGKDYVLTDEDLQKISALVDVPPEVYIGSEEPQGNEVIWVDNSTNPENINATKAYVDEKISNKQDAPKEQGTNGQVLGLSNGLPKWIDLPNQDDEWEFMGEIPIDLSEETSPLYEFALVKDFKRVRVFRIRPTYNSTLSTFERLGVTKAIVNGTSKKVELGYNNDGYSYHFYEMWIDNLKTPFLITTEHNNMLSPAEIRLSSYRNSNIPNINSQLVTCQVTDQSAWYFEIDDKKKGWDGTEHYYWWGVRT